LSKLNHFKDGALNSFSRLQEGRDIKDSILRHHKLYRNKKKKHVLHHYIWDIINKLD